MNNFIKKHCVSFSIVLFVFLFFFIQTLQPTFLYKYDGSLRDFGIGTKNKTILPIWLFAFILAVFCYIIVLSIANSGKFKF